jgi:hypothetical protein
MRRTFDSRHLRNAVAATLASLLLSTAALAQSSESGAGANTRGSANAEAGIGGRVGSNLGNSSISGSTSMGTAGSGAARIGPTLDNAGVTGPTPTGLYGYGRETSGIARTGIGLDSAASGQTDPGSYRSGGRGEGGSGVLRDPADRVEDGDSLSVKLRPLTEPAMNSPTGSASAIVPPMPPNATVN